MRLLFSPFFLSKKIFSLRSSPGASIAPQKTAVVTAAVQDLFTRPDETSPVDDQVILGERVEILEDAAGFARVRTAAGEVAWIPERALRRGDGAAPRGREGRARDVELRPRLRFARLSPQPVRSSRAPVGATMAVSKIS